MRKLPLLSLFEIITKHAESVRSLPKLVQKLNVNERAAIRAAITRKQDIASALPFELILHVFEYLPLLDAWRLQCVCKPWHKALSSEEFQRAVISRWNTHDPSDSGSTLSAIADDSTRTKFRHMQAWKLGRPYTTTLLEDLGSGITGHATFLFQPTLILKGSKIAYILRKSGDGDAVVVHDLVTGVSRSFRGEARERIRCMILTTTLVAFVTFQGILYVNELSNSLGKTSRIQLPSARVSAVGGHLGTIALVTNATGFENAYKLEVIIYDATTQQLRNLPVQAECGAREEPLPTLRSCSVLVEHNKAVDAFCLREPTGCGPDQVNGSRWFQLLHMRISINGELLATSSWHHPLSESRVSHAPHGMMLPQPTGYQDHYRIQVAAVSALSNTGGLTSLPTFAVRFNTKYAKFTGDDSEMPPQLTRQLQRVPQGGLFTVWKNRYFTPLDYTDTWRPYVNFMNDTFMVYLEEYSKRPPQVSRIRVFCFDDSVHMARAKSVELWEAGAGGGAGELASGRWIPHV